MLTPRQLTGRDESHLVELDGGHRLLGEVAEAFEALRADAAGAGFDLAIASGFRSFERQRRIWNGKADGSRPVHDDAGAPVAIEALEPAARLRAILRFSAIPGTSRHHWGTDLDVFDAAAMPEGYRLELSPAEAGPGGLFDALHRWLDQRMAIDQSFGFFRPYAVDRGGTAPERWHLSYAPLAQACALRCNPDLLQSAWDAGGTLALRSEIEAAWPDLFARYIDVPPGWAGRT
jgi:LAS superfamily LD-carboxypeptidase LdcB